VSRDHEKEGTQGLFSSASGLLSAIHQKTRMPREGEKTGKKKEFQLENQLKLESFDSRTGKPKDFFQIRNLSKDLEGRTSGRCPTGGKPEGKTFGLLPQKDSD